MGEYHPDSLLIAKPDLTDPNFNRTVVYLLAHEADGALGVVLNRPMVTPVASHFEQLVDRVAYPPVFFEGGPVASGTVVAVGGTVSTVPQLLDIDQLIDHPEQAPEQVRLFVGYAGWSAGQLEAEIAGGSWIVASVRRDDLGRDDVFGASPGDLWRAVLRRQPRPVSQLALYPEDLLVN